LEEWEYSYGLSIGGNISYKVEEIEYLDLERMVLLDSALVAIPPSLRESVKSF
jgi:hypothetical protein